jgi:hypothetical protein
MCVCACVCVRVYERAHVRGGRTQRERGAKGLVGVRHGWAAAVAYKSVREDEGASIQLVDVGRQFIINKITGFLQSRIVYYLMNLHTQPRSIYLTRVRHTPV